MHWTEDPSKGKFGEDPLHLPRNMLFALLHFDSLDILRFSVWLQICGTGSSNRFQLICSVYACQLNIVKTADSLSKEQYSRSLTFTRPSKLWHSWLHILRHIHCSQSYQATIHHTYSRKLVSKQPNDRRSTQRNIHQDQSEILKNANLLT